VDSEASGPTGERFTSYLCPGEQSDPVCMERVTVVAGTTERPGWAEYVDEY
jgi:hypothetical protein